MAGFANILQSIGGSLIDDEDDGYSLGVMPSEIPVGAFPPVEEPRQSRPRRSIIDIIGEIGNALSTGGGTPEEALYRTREQRAMDEAQRQRMIRAEEQKIQMGEQTLTGNDMELRGQQNALLGQSVKGLRQVYSRNPAALPQAWKFITQQLGVRPERAAEIGEALMQDPEGTITMLESALVEEKPQGSKPKEIAIYELLQQEDPESAGAYLKSLTQGGQMTPYQAAQVRIAEGRLAVAERNAGLAREKYENPPPSAAERAASTPRSTAGLDAAEATIDQIEDALGRLKKSGSMSAAGMTGNQRIGAAAYENVPLLERITNPEGFSARQDLDRLLGQSILQLVPLLSDVKIGGKNIDAAKELEFWKNTIASAKDYESAQRALTGFRARIAQLRAAQTTPELAARPRQTGTLSPRIKPRGASAAPKPAPKVGTVLNGWRFNGGDPKQKSSWSKVN